MCLFIKTVPAVVGSHRTYNGLREEGGLHEFKRPCSFSWFSAGRNRVYICILYYNIHVYNTHYVNFTHYIPMQCLRRTHAGFDKFEWRWRQRGAVVATI